MGLILIILVFVIIILIIVGIWWLIKKSFPEWEQFINIFTMLVGVFGVIFLVYELQGIRKQNEITERSFRQSYRPLGVIDWGDKSTSYSSTRNKNGTITVGCQKRILNNGKGILLFIGYLKFFSRHEIDFHSKSLIQNIDKSNNIIDSTSFDKRFPQRRLNPILSQKEDTINVEWNNIKPEDFKPENTNYYLYSIYLYKDQINYLYETICQEYNRLEPDSKKIVVVNTQYFHSYSKEEQSDLADKIEPYHESLAEYIR